MDIACGTGYGSLIIKKAGASKVTGVDISQETIDYAEEKYPHKNIKYIVGDAQKIPLKNQTVDIVVSFETLEHVQHYKKFTKEIQRVLKKDGLLIVSTPNIILGTESANPFHIKEFSLKEFRKLLNQNFCKVKIFGQKPVHPGYLNLTTKITSLIPPGILRWFVDTCFKYVFRGTKIIALSHFKHGFVPAIFVGVAKKKG